MRGQAADIANIAAKKQKTLEAGFRLISEKGIESVTLRAITEESGIGLSSFFIYYPSKLDLVIAIGAWKWREYIGQRVALLSKEERDGMTAAEHLRWYMDSYIDLYRCHSDILRFNYSFNSFLNNERPSQEQRMPFLKVVEELRELFHELYEKGVRDGTLRTDITEEAMLSSSFHIMLAAVTRYAIGLVYVPETGTAPESELMMLEELLLSRYTQ